jgi:hypothetical protein
MYWIQCGFFECLHLVLCATFRIRTIEEDYFSWKIKWFSSHFMYICSYILNPEFNYLVQLLSFLINKCSCGKFSSIIFITLKQNIRSRIPFIIICLTYIQFWHHSPWNSHCPFLLSTFWFSKDQSSLTYCCWITMPPSNCTPNTYYYLYRYASPHKHTSTALQSAKWTCETIASMSVAKACTLVISSTMPNVTNNWSNSIQMRL